MPERAAGAFRIFSGFVWYSGITKIARAAAACAASHPAVLPAARCYIYMDAEG